MRSWLKEILRSGTIASLVMITDQILNFLRTVPIFHALEQDQLEPLARAAEVRTYAPNDVIIAPAQIDAMRPCVEDLQIAMLDDCGHWSQQERPAEINALLLDWLARHR